MRRDTSLKLLAGLLIGACSLLLCASMASADHLRRSGYQPTEPYTPVYSIQGSEMASPFVDERVSTFGLVTGLTPGGFYLQDPVGDGNAQTSDGIYVFTYSPPTVRSSDCVVVRDALVQEYYGKTELSWVGEVAAADVCPRDTIAPVALPVLRLGVNPQDVYERFEGMLVEIGGLDGIVHGPTKRYTSGEAEIALLPDYLQPAVQNGRIIRTSEVNELPDADWTGDSLQFLSSLLGGELPSANWGDRLYSGQDGTSPLRAVLDYNFGKYQFLLLPGQSVMVDAQSPILETGLVTAGDDFTVCTLNVHGLGRGEAQYPERQDYAQEIGRVARLIAESMQGCLIIGVQETGTPADAAALAAALQEEYGYPYLAVADAGPMTVDSEFPLTNSFLVRADRVEVLDWFGAQGCTERDYEVLLLNSDECPPGKFPLFNRPPLVMDVLITGEWGETFALRLINNHWKSKAGDEGTNAVRRRLQAEHIASLVHDWLIGENGRDIVVLGDLNDFVDSAPISLLTEDAQAPLINVWNYLPAGDRYSYIFNGASQVLDHILISPDMVQFLSGVDAVHVNSDYAMCQAGRQRESCQASDHDPLMIRLRPEGSAAVGGELGHAGVVVTLEHIASGQNATDVTGDDGAYRLWDIEPGEVRIQYTPPKWMTVEGTPMTTVLATGYTRLEPPVVHSEPMIQAAASASALVDAIVGD